MSAGGKILLWFGVVMVLLGVVLLAVGNLSGKVPWRGRPPGGMSVEHHGWKVHVPLTTGVVISVILTLIFPRRAWRACLGRPAAEPPAEHARR